MTPLTEAVIAAYSMTESDIAALTATLFEQLRLSYLERLRTLAVQHGATNPIPQLQGAELERLQAKARTDAQSIADTYNRELASQVNAIYNRNPLTTRAEFIGNLASWGRTREARKSIEIAIYTILWAANYGFDLFITRNNLQSQLFRAVGGVPQCLDCIKIVGFGIVNFRTTQEYPLPYHINCSHEWSVVNATDLTANGNLIWIGG
jgi:hypothetical protein